MNDIKPKHNKNELTKRGKKEKSGCNKGGGERNRGGTGTGAGGIRREKQNLTGRGEGNSIFELF